MENCTKECVMCSCACVCLCLCGGSKKEPREADKNWKYGVCHWTAPLRLLSTETSDKCVCTSVRAGACMCVLSGERLCKLPVKLRRRTSLIVQRYNRSPLCKLLYDEDVDRETSLLFRCVCLRQRSYVKADIWAVLGEDQGGGLGRYSQTCWQPVRTLLRL